MCWSICGSELMRYIVNTEAVYSNDFEIRAHKKEPAAICQEMRRMMSENRFRKSCFFLFIFEQTSLSKEHF